MGAPNDGDEAKRREHDLRALIELEQRCAELRSGLGMKHRLSRPPVSAAADEAVRALIATHASEFLSLHGADGTYLWASDSCTRMFGWTPEQMLGRSAYDYFHPDDLARIADNHAQHVSGDIVDSIEYRLRTADGSYRWVETHSTNIKDAQGLPQIVGFTRDVSARRAREEEARALLAERESAASAAQPGGKPLVCMCAWCKAVSETSGWTRLEDYLIRELRRDITHGICPTCLESVWNRSRSEG